MRKKSITEGGDVPTPEDLAIAADIEAGLARAAKPRPRVSVRERRFQHPFGESAPTIEFKEPGRVARWFNEDVRNGQVYRAKKDLGWEHVTVDLIANLDSLGAHSVDPSGYIVRGARGSEYLMWMPKADWIQIQAAKTAENNDRMKNPHRQRQEAIAAYGGENPDGAELVDDQKYALTGTVKTTRERIQVTGELE